MKLAKQISSIRQIHQKKSENNNPAHQLNIDIRIAYDAVSHWKQYLKVNIRTQGRGEWETEASWERHGF